MKRTISAMRGKGSLTHNRRDFIAENVDSSRTPLNVEYRNEDIRTVYAPSRTSFCASSYFAASLLPQPVNISAAQSPIAAKAVFFPLCFITSSSEVFKLVSL